MKQVSIHDLKAQLSAVVSAAEHGETVVITRHNTPVARLGPAGTRGTYSGRRVGSGRLEPALQRATKGRYLAVLCEDRTGQ
jgi:prevent-host-death family protein